MSSFRVAFATAVLSSALNAAALAAQGHVQNPHGSLATPCAQCHTSTGWKPARIAREFRHVPARFPLEGAHARTKCTACHTSLDFKVVSATCAGCHTDVHRGELGGDCVTCHTPRSFIDRAAMARAHQTTRFPLTGSHAVLDCTSCHAPTNQGHLRFVNRSTQCESCHRVAAVAAKEPDHTAAGFTRQCESCHSPITWARARFDHASTSFRLTGAHATATCQACHSDRVYAGKSTACVSCHQAEYDRAADPPHRAASFPTTCATCHSSSSTWRGATFDHDGPYFPIYSGAHRGKWTSCSTCHVNTASYATFTCLSCHRQTETDGHHREVSGYRYESQACYTCHRNGRSP